MTFSYSLFKYNISDIIESTASIDLLDRYRDYFRKLHLDKRQDTFESLISLSDKHLDGLRLESITFRINSSATNYSLICVKEKSMNITNKLVIYKRVFNNIPRYRLTPVVSFEDLDVINSLVSLDI